MIQIPSSELHQMGRYGMYAHFHSITLWIHDDFGNSVRMNLQTANIESAEMKEANQYYS